MEETPPGLLLHSVTLVNGQNFYVYVPLDNGKIIEGDPSPKEIEGGPERGARKGV